MHEAATVLCVTTRCLTPHNKPRASASSSKSTLCLGGTRFAKAPVKYLYSWHYSVVNCTTSSNSLSCLISSKSGLRYTAVAKRTSVFLGPLFVGFKVDDISTIKSARILVGVTSTSCIKNTYRIQTGEVFAFVYCLQHNT